MSMRNPLCRNGTNGSNIAPVAMTPCSKSKGSPSPTTLKKIPFEARCSAEFVAFIYIVHPPRRGPHPARGSSTWLLAQLGFACLT
jgi:hypothetical protein